MSADKSLKTVVCATPIQLPDRSHGTIVGDRILEGACEGIVRMNQEYIRSGIISSKHPYDDFFNMVYARDPASLGDINVDGTMMMVREYWATCLGAAARQKDDCETLSAWLAAWYREICGVNAACAIYPTIVAPGGIVGRHVVVWVPMDMPIYTSAPFHSNRFIRHHVPGKGFIEDPSVALGMYYVTSPEKNGPMPERESFILLPENAANAAAGLRVPYLPAHWINL